MNKSFVFVVTFAGAMIALSLPAFAGVSGGGGGTVTVPEPATLAMLATGIGAVALVRRFRSK